MGRYQELFLTFYLFILFAVDMEPSASETDSRFAGCLGFRAQKCPKGS